VFIPHPSRISISLLIEIGANVSLWIEGIIPAVSFLQWDTILCFDLKTKTVTELTVPVYRGMKLKSYNRYYVEHN
jgi:hypothetical protein